MTMCPVGLNTPSDVGNFSFVSLFMLVLPNMGIHETMRFRAFHAVLDIPFAAF
jgi:uncharacterized membrane protein